MARGEIPPDADVDELALVSATLLDGALVAVAEQGDALDRDVLRDLIVRTIASVSGLRAVTR
jgi:hypothetical protein